MDYFVLPGVAIHPAITGPEKGPPGLGNRAFSRGSHRQSQEGQQLEGIVVRQIQAERVLSRHALHP